MQGQPTYPKNHQPFLRVPRGGSMCLNCRFVSQDRKHCASPDFIKFDAPNKPGGSNELPYPADQMCSDWWEPHGGKAKAGGSRFAKAMKGEEYG